MPAFVLSLFVFLSLIGPLSQAAPACAQMYSDWSVRRLGSGISGTAYLHLNSVTNQSFVEKIYNMPSQRENDQKAFALLHRLEDLGVRAIPGLRILRPEWLALETPANGGRAIAKSRLPFAPGPTLEQALREASASERSALESNYRQTLDRLLKLCQDSGFCRGELERDFDGSFTLMMGGSGAMVMIKPDNLILDRGSGELTVVDPF